MTSRTVNTSLLLATLLLSGGALAITVIRGGLRAPVPAAATGDAGLSRLASLIELLQRAQRELQATNRELANRLAGLEAARSTPGPGGLDLAQFRHQLDDVIARQEQLTRSTRELDKYGVLDAMERELETAYATLLDEQQPLKVRLKQVDRLKQLGHFDERAAQAVVNAFAGSTNYEEKAAALQVLAGSVRTREFRDQVLLGLQTELAAGGGSPRFRYHAIEALEPMLPDPVIEQWLRHLAQNDPEYKIAFRAGQPVGITPPAPAETR